MDVEHMAKMLDAVSGLVGNNLVSIGQHEDDHDIVYYTLSVDSEPGTKYDNLTDLFRAAYQKFVFDPDEETEPECPMGCKGSIKTNDVSFGGHNPKLVAPSTSWQLYSCGHQVVIDDSTSDNKQPWYGRTSPVE